MPRGGRRLPDACVAHLRAADAILHAGDLVSAAFLAELRRLGPPVHAVHGNVDEPALRELLPAERVVEAGDVRIGMVHAAGPRAGREGRLTTRFPGCHVVVYGHTHIPQIAREGDVWIVNPGSPTERRRAATRAMALLEVVGGAVRPRLVELGA